MNAQLLFNHVIMNNPPGVAHVLAANPYVVDAWSAHKYTPLMLAVTCGLYSVAEVLLDGGCVSRAVQFHPHGGQSDFARSPTRTPHGAYVWVSWRDQDTYQPGTFYRPAPLAGPT